MLQSSRIPNAMYSTSQHFQLVYFCRFATFSKARHAAIYGVSNLDDRNTPNVQKHVGACEAVLQKTVVRTCSSCTSMIRILFGQIRQHKASCTPGFVEQRTCITKWRGGWGGAQPPPFEKHKRRSEQTSFLHTLNKLFFCIVLALRNSGGEVS